MDARQVNPEHAGALGEVFLRAAATDSHDTVLLLLNGIAHDLSGRHGEQHVIRYRGYWLSGRTKLAGEIFCGGDRVGVVDIICRLDNQRRLVVSMGVEDVNNGTTGLVLDRAELFPVLRAVLGRYFERSGIDYIEGPILATPDDPYSVGPRPKNP